jgi:lipopolysaccharide/colanic/teichoic acid biosynthesis glycosyltransferase
MLMNAQFQNKEENGELTTIALDGGEVSQLTEADLNSTAAKLPSSASGQNRRRGFRADWPGKRLYDFSFAVCGLVLLCPLLAVITALVKITSGGDVFFRQARVGRGGREFLIYKFRTMVAAAETSGPSVTKNGDARITRLGRFLRRSKLDELPQLWNVVKGDMSLVGPRPEVPRYVRHYTPEQRAILRLKPGITDLASLYFRDEEALLAHADNVEEFYLRHCVPRKLRLNQEYAGRANFLSDTWVILQTVCPYWISVLAGYGLILTASYWLSYELIYNFAPPDFAAPHFGRELAVTLALQLACLMWHRQCRGMLSYFSFPEARKVGAALGLAAVGLLFWSVAGNGFPPANVILINALLSFCLLGGFRVLLRRWRERSAAAPDAANPPARVGIIGAGRMGAQLALDLADNRKFSRQVVAFFDDDFHKWQKNIHDVPVAGMPECLLDGWAQKLDEVVIALPGSAAERAHEIEQLLRHTSLKCYTVTSPVQFWERKLAA